MKFTQPSSPFPPGLILAVVHLAWVPPTSFKTPPVLCFLEQALHQDPQWCIQNMVRLLRDTGSFPCGAVALNPPDLTKLGANKVKLKICRLRVCWAGASPEPAHLGTTVTPCACASSDLTADPRTFNLGVPEKKAGGALILTRSARLFYFSQGPGTIRSPKPQQP